MTVAVENNPETQVIQDKVDVSSLQQNIDPNLSQQISDNKEIDTNEDPNWRAFREARKKDRADREAAERRAAEKEAEVAALKAAMEAAFNKGPNQMSSNTSHEFEQEETEDERIEKKVQAAIAAREAQAEVLRQQREQQEYPNRLTQAYPDFHAVISSENLDYLDYHYPEVSRPLKRLNDNFDKWSDIYQAIKKFVPNSVTAKKEAAKADANFNKPRSMSSVGMTQNTEAAKAIRLTEDRKAANWARMQQTMKGVS